jgi:hypothetical protein
MTEADRGRVKTKNVSDCDRSFADVFVSGLSPIRVYARKRNQRGE